MSIQTRNQLIDLLLSLRQRLLDAREKNDKTQLSYLKITFGTLVEAAYTVEDKALVAILVDLEDAARDSITGVDWKSSIPSIEVIEKSCV
ncbi:MAG: hypothetical protein H7175_03890 [Burkholderiales bacterium]|nr:hypothetical protein [Anaerolineae bacterium]